MSFFLRLRQFRSSSKPTASYKENSYDSLTLLFLLHSPPPPSLIAGLKWVAKPTGRNLNKEERLSSKSSESLNSFTDDPAAHSILEGNCRRITCIFQGTGSHRLWILSLSFLFFLLICCWVAEKRCSCTLYAAWIKTKQATLLYIAVKDGCSRLDRRAAKAFWG